MIKSDTTNSIIIEIQSQTNNNIYCFKWKKFIIKQSMDLYSFFILKI